jgi:hypothetical protein
MEQRAIMLLLEAEVQDLVPEPVSADSDVVVAEAQD